MIEQKYSRLNTIIGWCVFLVAVSVYWSTVEPTASFWDCSENLSIYYKLEVGHPPGEPFLQLIQHCVSLLSFGDVHKVAPIINRSCGVLSSFTILFLFWSISYFAKKMMTQKGELTDSSMYAVLGAALVGSLSFIFADSFWFSATEASVWSASLCFSTLMFWCGTKMARSKEPERWVIFISFLIGLSIGVHMLCILVIPAVVFLYFYREQQNSTTPKWITNLLKKVAKTPDGLRLLSATIMAIVLLGMVKSLVIPGLINVATDLELFFVNVIGLPFNSGVIIYGILISAIIIWGLMYSKKKNKAGMHTAFMSAAVMILGYCTFILLVIRANADPPLNEDAPSDTIMLHDYLDRKQYGDFPVLYGPYFTAPPPTSEDTGPVYAKDVKKGRYIVISHSEKEVYNSDFCTLFTRMWDASEGHPQEYKNWIGNDLPKIPYIDPETGAKQMIERPTYFQNLNYFFRYQLGLMYFRYLLWDFVGRQNDVQCTDPPDNLHGNFITGIPFIDSLRQPQENMPDELARNKARSVMYGIPFLLGLLGFFYMANKDPKRFNIVLVMFFFTGIAIILFLNQKPHEPRERDYSYVGSFFAFSIWIGFGALAIFDLLLKQLAKDENGKKLMAVLATIAGLTVPVLMARAEWAAHDRSKRYTTRDFAIDYLESCPQNAILFCGGDNDTFPLWYAQEVEGIRTDVRVCNTELMGMAWYVDQMNHKAYNSDRMPFTLTHDQYREGTREYLLVNTTPGSRFAGKYCNLADVFEFVKSDNEADKIEMSDRQLHNYLPTNKFKISVNKDNVIKSGIVSKNMSDSMPSEITWDMPGRGIMRANMMELDAIAHNDWKRPLCFAVSSGNEAYIGLEKYFKLEGLVFVLTPFKNPGNSREPGVATDNMYTNVTTKFRWGNMGKGIYLDENIIRMATTLRYQSTTLAQALLAEHKKDSAIKVLNLCMDSISEASCPYDGSVVMLDRTYFEAGDFKKADTLAKELFNVFESDLIYYNSLTGANAVYYSDETQNFEVILQQLTYFCQQYKQDSLEKTFEARLEKLNKMGYLKYITKP